MSDNGNQLKVLSTTFIEYKSMKYFNDKLIQLKFYIHTLITEI